MCYKYVLVCMCIYSLFALCCCAPFACVARFLGDVRQRAFFFFVGFFL
jgi:hypothetical protein